MKQQNITLLVLLICLASVSGGFLYIASRPADGTAGTPTPLPRMGGTPLPDDSNLPLTPTPSALATPTPSSAAILSLPVPFTPQAPTGNWDQLHEEACEETSAIMAHAYLSGDTREVIPAAEVEQQITKLVNWENSNFGYSLDTTAQETAQMIQSVYGLHASVVHNFSENDIEKAIQAHSVVILPVNGREVGNPHYTPPGPIYHMLVLRGYTATQIITNDSGTRYGENYRYSFSTLQNAGADWSHTTNTVFPSQVMIVVSK